MWVLLDRCTKFNMGDDSIYYYSLKVSDSFLNSVLNLEVVTVCMSS